MEFWGAVTLPQRKLNGAPEDVVRKYNNCCTPDRPCLGPRDNEDALLQCGGDTWLMCFSLAQRQRYK